MAAGQWGGHGGATHPGQGQYPPQYPPSHQQYPTNQQPPQQYPPGAAGYPVPYEPQKKKGFFNW